MRRYLIAGILTMIPVWITWLVFNFVFTQLSRLGMPWVRAWARTAEANWPTAAQWLQAEWFQTALAVLVTLLGLMTIGWIATRVVGQRLLALFDRLIDRIPIIERVYGATKQLVGALTQRPEGAQRVVLISFPNAEMKTVGLVTRTMLDRVSGRELAAVYVPTTPNPTSGYLEIVPVEALIETDWSMDEAMTFIVSGGALAPERGIHSGL